MKLKSLILGSVAAAGLSTAGFAADLGVLTSLDVCDELGLSGLTISSDTNCLQISGGVSYEFSWGDYAGSWNVTNPYAGAFNVMDNNGDADDHYDWNSKVEAWLKFVGTASSDFGPAKAVIKLKAIDQQTITNDGDAVVGTISSGDTQDFKIDEAYVQIGDATVIMAGKKGSIANFNDDEPFNWLGLFNSEKVDKGVMFVKDNPKTGGHVIQVVSDLGNGVSAGLALENLNGAPAAAGTVVGLLEYKGDGITAHLTALAGGILDGVVDDYAVHADFTGTFDMFKIRGAVAAGHDVATATSYWNALASAEAAFDMFKIALSGEVASDGTDTDYGFGGSIGATVTEGVSINLGGRYYNDATGVDGWQVAAQLVAAVTETLKVTGEVGVFGRHDTPAPADATDFYGKVALDWAPGGGFTSSIAGEAHQNGAYKVTFKAAKSFE